MPCVRRFKMVIQTLMPSGINTQLAKYKSTGHGKSEYSRPEVTPAHSNVNPTVRPMFHRKQFHIPSFSDQSLLLPSAGVIYIMAMAKAIEIQPKITASTCTCRICPNAKNSFPVTKSGNASLAALNDPNPVPITNQTIDENPKNNAEEPLGISSFLPKKYLSIFTPPVHNK